MTDVDADDAEDRLAIAMAVELAALRDEGTIPIEIDATSAFILISVLQLALRHPTLPAHVRAEADRMVATLTELFARCPACWTVIQRGNDPSQDVPIDGPRILFP